MTYSGGTWRRLKIAAELRVGHRIPPALPRDDLVRLVGLLVGLREGRSQEVLASESLQFSLGLAEVGAPNAEALRLDALRQRVGSLAASTDARKFL